MASHTVLIDDNLNAYSCGRNNCGQLGNGSRVSEEWGNSSGSYEHDNCNRSFFKIDNLPLISKVGCGDNHTIFLDLDGFIWFCGSNVSSFLVEFQLLPVRIQNMPIIKDISVCGYNNLLLDWHGNVWRYGVLSYDADTCEAYEKKPLEMIENIPKISQISCGDHHLVLLDVDGYVWMFGFYIFEGLGNQTEKIEYSGKVFGIPIINKIISGPTDTCLIDINHNVWLSGSNLFGKLGLGHPTPRINFESIIFPSLPRIIDGSIGTYHAILIDENFDIWTCGSNHNGQLGVENNLGCKFLFVKSTINFKVRKVTCYYVHTIFIDTDDNFWSCGDNDYGQLGMNSNSYISSPTKISGIKSISNTRYKKTKSSKIYPQDIHKNIL